MVQYISKNQRLREWVKQYVENLDEQPRVLSQLLASALIKGFKRKEVLELLGGYMELGEIFFNVEKNVIYSLRAVPRTLKEEMDEIFKGEVVK